MVVVELALVFHENVVAPAKAKGCMTIEASWVEIQQNCEFGAVCTTRLIKTLTMAFL